MGNLKTLAIGKRSAARSPKTFPDSRCVAATPTIPPLACAILVISRSRTDWANAGRQIRRQRLRTPCNIAAMKFLLFICVSVAFGAAPTVQDAKKFLDDAEAKLLILSNDSGRADWVHSNFITDDTEAISSQADEKFIAEGVRLAKAATRFDGVALPPDMARKMRLLKLGLTLAAPADPALSAEVTRLGASLEGTYGKGKWCPAQNECLDVEDITRTMANSTNPKDLLNAWNGWHKISPPMRKDFSRFVELSNQGARELGFKDTGAMWRAKYDMTPDEFSTEVDRLWDQVRPLYL